MSARIVRVLRKAFMELRVLRYFLAVAEAASVTAAAHQAHIAQPPLSRQLSALEKVLGVSLFTRRPRSLNLNAAGRRFRPIAQDGVRHAEQAAEAMSAMAQGEGAAVTVVASPPPLPTSLAGSDPVKRRADARGQCRGR
ncbi:LysR family transcriptional regulator [Streptomyces sp. NPDC057486]|uniref:LysR family transcriptional regulator n=1 Tax=Streptomyces sp. NPDC057486 TaxID=3346145 RepID=UPI0036D1F115